MPDASRLDRSRPLVSTGGEGGEEVGGGEDEEEGETSEVGEKPEVEFGGERGRLARGERGPWRGLEEGRRCLAEIRTLGEDERI